MRNSLRNLSVELSVEFVNLWLELEVAGIWQRSADGIVLMTEGEEVRVKH